MRGELLSNEEDVVLILIRLVQLDAGGMIDVLEDANLVEEQIWLLDGLLGDLLDGAPLGAVLLLGLVDGAVCALAELLRGGGSTLGLKS